MNAIILAAGMGTRLRPLTNEIPKCLVKVLGIPMVERQIQFLHEAGIKDIALISGYKAEKLDYLQEKYNVDIVFNERYDTCNNIYSLYKVLDRFGDSWIIEGDVYMRENCFTKDIHQSTYFAKWHERYENEWGLEFNHLNYLEKINIGSGKGCVMSGISFWTQDVANMIVSRIKDYIVSGQFQDLFWDNAVIDIYQMTNIFVNRFDAIFEIDTVKDLESFQ
ncbi:MAG: NTP transferase domain-containing protein [Prevotellaceae bacterium]|nr:NTP transferase domain-containing protein [Prevotellaceae bacterium]